MDTRPWEKSEIAKRFRTLRVKTQLFQSELAGLIGVCRQSISKIENGHTMPRLSTWDRFCDVEAKHNQPRIVLPVHWL